MKIKYSGLLLILLWSACNPAIRSFNADKITISSEDTVNITWDVSGTDTLLVSQHLDSTIFLPSNDLELFLVKKVKGAQLFVHGRNENITSRRSSIIELMLVASKHKKEVHQSIELIVLPDTSTDEVVFPTSSLSSGRDSVIAGGEKDKLRWGEKYHILSVASGSQRIIVAKHNNKSIILDSTGTYVNALQGESLAGDWELISPLTEKEKNDMTTAPEELRLKVIIIYKR